MTKTMIDQVKVSARNMSALKLLEHNRYTFDVNAKTTKSEVKHLIQEFFGIRVIRMNSYRLPKKVRRGGNGIAKASQSKRMIVTIPLAVEGGIPALRVDCIRSSLLGRAQEITRDRYCTMPRVN